MSGFQSPFDFAVSSAVRGSIHDHWRMFLGEGIVLSILGLAAMAAPLIAGVVVTVFLGWLFLIAGVVGIAFAMGARRAPGFGWSLLSSVVALIVGGTLVWNPLNGLVTLTLVLTAFFVIDGILMIILAIAHRRELTGKWEWIMINGIIDLILAGVIIMGLPGTIAWALGLLVGIDMLFGGATLVAMALEARKGAAG